jgi:hypothetical protein
VGDSSAHGCRDLDVHYRCAVRFVHKREEVTISRRLVPCNTKHA